MVFGSPLFCKCIFISEKDWTERSYDGILGLSIFFSSRMEKPPFMCVVKLWMSFGFPIAEYSTRSCNLNIETTVAAIYFIWINAISLEAIVRDAHIFVMRWMVHKMMLNTKHRIKALKVHKSIYEIGEVNLWSFIFLLYVNLILYFMFYL